MVILSYKYILITQNLTRVKILLPKKLFDLQMLNNYVTTLKIIVLLEACVAKDLLEGDEEWQETMKKHHFGKHHINW